MSNNVEAINKIEIEARKYYNCVYCGEICNGKLTIGSGDKSHEVEDDYLNILCTSTKPIHTRCLEKALLHIRFIAEDYPKLKNVIMMMQPANARTKAFKWSDLMTTSHSEDGGIQDV